MKHSLIAASTALALLAAGCATDPYGYGGGGFGGTQLSACTRNALIGAGIGAVGGAIINDRNRGENAAIGAAVGGAGAYAACRFLGVGDEQRVYGAYNSALASGRPQTLSLAGAQGAPQPTLRVAPPQAVPGAPNCRTVSATVTAQGQGAQPLPVERYCQTPQGTWVPG